MLNAERFRNELLEILSENRYIEVDKYDRKIRKCTGNNCPKCMFGITALGKGRDSCSIAAMLWLLSEYKEPVKLSRFEHEYLERISNHSKFRYIARDEIGCIFAYENKPRKYSNHWNVIIEGGALARLPLCDDLYQFMSWEDEEPTPIKEVLDNCEVIDGESE